MSEENNSINDVGSGVPEVQTSQVQPVQPLEQGHNKLPGLKSLFSESWQSYTMRLKLSILLQLVTWLPIVVLWGVGFGLSRVVDFNNLSSGLIIAGMVIAIPIVIALIYLQIWVQASQIYLFMIPVETLTVKGLMTEVRSKLSLFFASSLLSGLAVLGGFILLVIPGIIFLVKYTFSTYIALEGSVTRARDSLTKSGNYVRGYWWDIFGRMLVMGILYLLISLIVGFIGGFVDAIITGTWFSQIFGNVSFLFIIPFFLSLGYTLYKQLKSVNPI